MLRSRLLFAVGAVVAVVVAAAIAWPPSTNGGPVVRGAMTKAAFTKVGMLVGQAYKDTDSLSLGLTGSCKTEGCLDKRRVALSRTFFRLEAALADGGRYRGSCGVARRKARTTVISTHRLLDPLLTAVYRKQGKKANTIAGQFKARWAVFDQAARTVHDTCAPAS